MKWHHVGIEVNSLEESLQFYQSYFGFSLEKEFKYEDETIYFIRRGPLLLELVQSEGKRKEEHRVHFSWLVDHIYEWISDLHLKHLYPIEGPTTLENGWRTVFYEGPDNEIIELFQE